MFWGVRKEKRCICYAKGTLVFQNSHRGTRKHAFELLAYEHIDVSTRASGSGTGATIIDRLILRAGSSDDMNTWAGVALRSCLIDADG